MHTLMCKSPTNNLCNSTDSEFNPSDLQSKSEFIIVGKVLS
jgi:hypothetical protein